MSDLFRDRRPDGHLPRAEDYGTPVTRTTLAAANRRFRETGVQLQAGWDREEAGRLIRKTIKDRFNGRRSGWDDFPTVGDYLEYMNGLTS
jgi:hypothetical protein